jgi:hypothetical protein
MKASKEIIWIKSVSFAAVQRGSYDIGDTFKIILHYPQNNSLIKTRNNTSGLQSSSRA